MFEIPVELVRKNFETNVFAALDFTQRVVRNWVRSGIRGKVVFVSSAVGLLSVAPIPAYAASKHAVQSIAEAMYEELKPFGIQVQVINPGGYLTGFNETEAESSSHWMDDRANYIKLDTVTTFFNQILSTDDNRMDPQRMADAMVSIIPEETGLFRNVVPKATEELARNVQRSAGDVEVFCKFLCSTKNGQCLAEKVLAQAHKLDVGFVAIHKAALYLRSAEIFHSFKTMSASDQNDLS